MIAQNGRDVFEDDAFFRKIRHIANAGAEFVDYVGIHKAMLAGARLGSTARASRLFLCQMHLLCFAVSNEPVLIMQDIVNSSFVRRNSYLPSLIVISKNP